VNSIFKLAVGAAAIVASSTACSPAATAPGSAAPPASVAPSSATISSPDARSSAAISSPAASSGQQAVTLTVAGSDVTSSPLSLTVLLPPGWESFHFGADNGTSSPPAGMAFVVSLVYSTFANPCVHVQPSPKIGPTVADLATALGKIPDTTATQPVQTTIAGHNATYIELAIPASLPCTPSEFDFWQDSPGGDWWVQGLNETARIWIIDVDGQRVAFLTHAYPGSAADPKSVFEAILNSVVFSPASTRPSASPAASY